MALRIVGVIKHKNKIVAYDIYDTTKGDTARFSKEQVVDAMSNRLKIENAKLQYYNGKPIIRVSYTENKEEITGQEVIDILKNNRVGIPLKIKITQNGEYKQVLYNGNNNGTFYFYDKEGVGEAFGFTERFIVNNPDRIKFKFNDNDSTKVAELIKSLAESN